MKNNTTPLIVCGRPRSGTRYITTVLNKFPGVHLQGEIPPGVMTAMQSFIESVEAEYGNAASGGDGRRVRQCERWRENKEELIAACWTYLPQGGATDVAESLRYYGYKRPGHEHYIDFYERHLLKKRPVYVYCIRGFREHYLSVKSRWPHRPIEKVMTEYRESIECYWRAKLQCGDRVLTFVLDDLKERGLGEVERRILEPLGLDVNGIGRESLLGIEARNRTVEDHGITRRGELTNDEARYIEQNSDLISSFAEIRKAVNGTREAKA